MNSERRNVDYGDGELAKQNEVLRTTVGSEVHGIHIPGTEDHDELGIFILPPDWIIGIKGWFYKGNRFSWTGETMDRYVYRTKPEGVRSGHGDTDLNMYELRKYIDLAIVGNPTVLLPLFAPFDNVIHMTAPGSTLRQNRHSFLSQRALHRYLRYMEAQHDRMLGLRQQGKVPKRPELIEEYGWDTKYGSHALRLAFQGYEIAKYGDLTLPLPDLQREEVLAAKTGKIPKDEVSARIKAVSSSTQELLDSGKAAVPPEPDYEHINDLVRELYLSHWTRTNSGTTADFRVV